MSANRGFQILLAIVLLISFIMAFYCQKSKESTIHESSRPNWLIELKDSLAGKTHWNKVIALRHFAHKTFNMGSRPFYMNYATIDTMPLETVFEVFRQDLGAVKCGGTSLYLNKLYKKFGYRSWSYDVGEVYEEESGASHQFNLVEVPIKGDTLITVQDAYFDHTLVNKNGNPLDFFKILSLLIRKHPDSIIKQKLVNTTYVDYLMGNQKQFYNHTLDTNLMEYFKASVSHRYSISNHPAGFKKMSFKHNFSTFSKITGKRYLSFLKANGYPPNFLYLLLFPKTLIGPEKDKMRAKIDSIINHRKSIK